MLYLGDIVPEAKRVVGARRAEGVETTIMDKEYKRTQPVAESFLLIYFSLFPHYLLLIPHSLSPLFMLDSPHHFFPLSSFLHPLTTDN